MNIAVLGLGHVGSVTAGCLAKLGHKVHGFDINPAKVGAINDGRSPVVEPGLDEIIGQARVEGRLAASIDIHAGMAECDVALVCVGTPSAGQGEHDLSHISNVSAAIAQSISPQRNSKLIVAYRSTVQPGTCESVIAPIFQKYLGQPANDRVEIIHHPEFLREGSAVKDFLQPSRIVIGTRGGSPSEKLASLYDGYDCPIFHVGIKEAEMIKLVDNSWHAMKVAFANEIGRTCEMQGVSAETIHELFVADTTLNTSDAYLRPGGPFGGSCLPKDVRALQEIGSRMGLGNHLIDSLLKSNDAHKRRQFLQARAGLRKGARLLFVGLAFKKGTDDLRESPQVELARRLIDHGFEVDIYDPHVVPDRLLGQNLDYATAHLPELAELMVTQEQLERTTYDRILVANDLASDLAIDGSKVFSLCTIP